MRRALITLLLAGLAILLGTAAVARASPPLRVGRPIAVPGIDSLNLMACARGDVCEAVGTMPATGAPGVVRIVDGVPGKPVGLTGAPAGDQLDIAAIACPTASFCVAVGGRELPRAGSGGAEVVVIVDGVPRPAVQPVNTAAESELYLTGVDCSSAARCIATGSDSHVDLEPITNGRPGRLVVQSADRQWGAGGVDICPRGACAMLVTNGARGALLSIRGTALGRLTSLPGIAFPGYGSCGSGRCEIVGLPGGETGHTDAAVSLRGGRFGATVPVPNGANGVVCLSASICVVASVLTGGASGLTPIVGNHVLAKVPAPIADPGQGACTAPGRCYFPGERTAASAVGELLPVDAG